MTRRRGRAVQPVTKTRDKNMTLAVAVIPAVGVVAAPTHLDGTNRYRFSDFLEKEWQPGLQRHRSTEMYIDHGQCQFPQKQRGYRSCKKVWSRRYLSCHRTLLNSMLLIGSFGSVKTRVSRGKARSQNHPRHYIEAQLMRIGTDKVQVLARRRLVAG
ncbi:hypothetical protein BCV69DRAFT_131296 [Microstroma glucosiphilum]|uniref:Uncharacterized protein n=1 Tax=Pseudomicrostroma glucosiphilum TaxID=1684307 RepID=A0A316TVS3_9BASI|nr:hypothetical protein BCV69DRAFT_131296 [Pseudomicrostroma glucosiphilum]PWN17649.1 hypothetical protein BCV69DRAFT_131296 [Pseudomicrostroma glucosiphilum]